MRIRQFVMPLLLKAEQESWQSVYDELVAVDPIAGQSLRFQIGNALGHWKYTELQVNQ